METGGWVPSIFPSLLTLCNPSGCWNYPCLMHRGSWALCKTGTFDGAESPRGPKPDTFRCQEDSDFHGPFCVRRVHVVDINFAGIRSRHQVLGE